MNQVNNYNVIMMEDIFKVIFQFVTPKEFSPLSQTSTIIHSLMEKIILQGKITLDQKSYLAKAYINLTTFPQHLLMQANSSTSQPDWTEDTKNRCKNLFFSVVLQQFTSAELWEMIKFYS